MALIGVLNSFVDGTVVAAAPHNANWTDVKTAFNTSAVLTDVAKTITVGHTWSAGQVWSAAQTFGAGITVSAGGLAVTGGITGSLTGNVTGNLTGTVLTAAQGNITSLGVLTEARIAALGKLYLDGGGDTYIYEQAANTLDLVAGGSVALRATSTYVQAVSKDLIITALNKFYLDGGVDTYIQESAANVISFVSGAVLAIRISGADTLFSGKLYLDNGGDTYLVESAANQVDLNVGGSVHFRASAATFALSARDLAVDPTKRVYFDSGSNTYIYESSADVLKIVTGATDAAIFSTAGIISNLTGTILTASQTNITAVGTLTALTVSGTADFTNNGLKTTSQIAVSYPAGSAGNNGYISFDTTNNRLVFYGGGARYWIAGTAF